jgi:membrane-bound metal-dependent hydrolase YbcI (DUF457 family)
MESNKIIISMKWLLLFLFITICSYLTYYTSQPHYHISLNSISHLLTLSSIDPGIAIISLVTGIVLTAIAHYELKKRSDKAQTK